ncbi:type II toxin-antitoxin system RelE/ParE family toxin [Hyalangium gracile]|uniref:type II toxin-antitoxin system RelE/ParE family toxin n=1 Tax=Hyalangium gracile TaxID=394092 RepID=UPI00295F2624|nr:type II toxin-antitoxin system RelE/ParE family toxin [Hyalangium gracile]
MGGGSGRQADSGRSRAGQTPHGEMTIQVQFTPRAESQVGEAALWWRTNRPAAPSLFEEELTTALQLLSALPDLGRRYSHPRVPGVRRLLMPRTRYHLYYVHDEQGRVVIVLALWSAVRGRGPALRKP